MANFLSINEAVTISGVPESEFYSRYIDGGIISVQVEDGVKRIETSEFLRVFPNAQLKPKASAQELEVENILQKQKIENLERQVAQLQRQLDKQFDEYDWLRTKFDNTTLLLEQKLDTSELDKYKQEIRQLNQQAVQWEKKYNTLLAANELKTLLKESRELKQQMEANAKELIASTKAEQQQLLQQQHSMSTVTAVKAVISPTETPEKLVDAKKRRKVFGIF